MFASTYTFFFIEFLSPANWIIFAKFALYVQDPSKDMFFT